MHPKSGTVKQMTIFSLFIAIELLLYFTPLGFLRIGALSITLMHIPVIAAGILLGKKEGAALGLIFGLCSVANATLAPGVTSFCFSPFITVGGISGNGFSLVIALVPRVLLGWIAGALFQLFNKRMGRGLAAGLAAGIATFCHTVMVLGLIVVLFGAQYAQALGMAQNLLLGLMASVVLTNGIPELIAASLCCMALAKAIRVKQPAYSS